MVTPFAAGHLLGGAVWRVRRNGEDYVYAVDYNHRRVPHCLCLETLSGCAGMPACVHARFCLFVDRCLLTAREYGCTRRC